MHKSPYHGQTHILPDPSPLRTAFLRPHSAKVLSIVVAWFCLIAICVHPLPGLSQSTQEKQQDAAASAEPTDQPASPATQAVDLSDEVVRDVLTGLQRGIETHDLDRVMGIFDQQNMKDYAQFHDQMVAFLRRYDSVRFRYQLLQVATDKDGSFAIADIDMDADPSDILPTQQRHSTQMRFQMKRGPKGWKVIALRPADFFNQ
jgi:hypothetical protein